MQSRKIDETRPQLASFTEVFEQLEDEFIKEASGVFPVVVLEHDIWTQRSSCLVLEEMFAMQVAGCSRVPMLEVDHWLRIYGKQTCKQHHIEPDTINMEYIRENIGIYHSAAFRLTSTLGIHHTRLTRLHAQHRHNMLNLDFSALLQIGEDTAFVSIHECNRPEHAYMYHRMASCFDPRNRLMVHEYVHKLAETSMDISPTTTATESGTSLWGFASQIAFIANRPISNMFCVFDLEWHNNDPKTRYTDGQIVDAHFEEIQTGWVIHSGTIRPYPAITNLSPFLLDHGYTLELLARSENNLENLRQRIHHLVAISDNCLFSAYNGINADMNILHHQGIYLPRYLDSTFILTGGKSISLSNLYTSQCGTTFIAHTARADSMALLTLLRNRGATYETVNQVWETLMTMQ